MQADRPLPDPAADHSDVCDAPNYCPVCEMNDMKRDARRWRFLRSQHEGDLESFHVTDPDCAPVGSLPGELDAVIDAALAKTTGAPNV